VSTLVGRTPRKNRDMCLRHLRWQLASLAVLCAWHGAAIGDEFCLDMTRPACGKVCKLVCDTKKLTSIGYGIECKSMCIPEPSRAGCKHCAVCYGKNDGKPCDGCSNCPPKCEFCWRDWFACGCAQPRTVRVLTKYQAEKKICWYHWEVVDAACCDCVSQSGPAAAPEKNAAKHVGRTIYKSAPENVQLGDVLPVSDEEWVKLAAVLSPDPAEVADNTVAETAPKPGGDKSGEATSTASGTKASSVAERIQRMLKK
jgi:hypothetical protein